MITLSDIIKASLILIAIGSAGINGDNASKYEGSKLFKIKKTPFVRRILEEEELLVWGENRVFYDVLVSDNKLDRVRSLLGALNISYAVTAQNVASVIRRHNPSKATTLMRGLDGQGGSIVLSQQLDVNRLFSNAINLFVALDPRLDALVPYSLQCIDTSDPNSPTFLYYQTFDEIIGYLDYLAAVYPSIASTAVMGHTINRKPLKYIKISSGKENAKTFFIDGGIHAREWISPAAVTYIIKQLVENREYLPLELLNLDFYILPVFNPDGYEYSFEYDRLWRKNRSKNGQCYGVDINRNFGPIFGGEGSKGYSCSEQYRGRYAYSELESAAFTKLLGRLNESLTGYVSFHSYGQYILIPYGYKVDTLPFDFNELKEVGDEAAAAMKKIDGKVYKVGNTASMLYPAAGTTQDWVKAYTFAKYVYTIELRDDGKHGFVLPEELILPTAKDAFEAIKVIAGAASRV